MTERVIHEVRFIETDDGFRVEVKGDKERMRDLGFGPGMGFGFGRRFGRRRWRRGHHGHGHKHHCGHRSQGPEAEKQAEPDPASSAAA